MNRKRYIGVLRDQDQQDLQGVVESSVSHRQRQRAQAILWSSEEVDMQTLLSLLKVDRDTLSSWFTRWQQQGLAGLADQARSGRPVKGTPEEKKKF